MHELLVAFEAQRVHLLLDDVFDGFHVVVGNRFDLLHARGVGRRKVAVEGAQRFELHGLDAAQLRQRDAAQGDEILHFDADAVADERLLGEIIGEFFRFTAVTAVDGRYGGEFVQHIKG